MSIADEVMRMQQAMIRFAKEHNCIITVKKGTMKIIKLGIIPAKKEIERFTCPFCGCVWEANKEEYSVHRENKYEGGTAMRVVEVRSMECPSCGLLTCSR